MKSSNELTDKQLNVLQNIGEVGSKSASTALQQLFNKNVSTSSPSINLVTKKDLKKYYQTDDPLTAVFFNVRGKMDATLINLFTRKNVLKLIDILMGKEDGSTMFVGEMGQSAIKEAANILSSSYLTALGSIVGAPLVMSTPTLAFNLRSAIDDYSIFGAENISHAIVIDTEFKLREVIAVGRIILLLKAESMEKLLENL